MRGKALLTLSDGRLLCSCGGRLRFYDTISERLLSETPLPLSGWKRLAVRFRLAERALHAECRWAHELPDGNILFSFENGVFSMDPAEGVIRREAVPVRGKPLSPTALRYTQNVGIVLLLLLMLLATKNDIVRVIFGG